MPRKINRTIAFIMRRSTVLVLFVLSALVTGIISGVQGETENAWLMCGLSVAVYATLAYFTYQKQLIATWTTILILIITGSDLLYGGFSSLIHDPESILADLIKCAVGIYLTWGALIIHKDRHLKV